MEKYLKTLSSNKALIIFYTDTLNTLRSNPDSISSISKDMKNIQEIAHRLIELLREKSFLEAQEELFSINATTQEPEKFSERSVTGLEAIMKKEKSFLSNIKQWNHFEVSDPIISNKHFSLRMVTDVILKNDFHVFLDEIIVYEVEDGKIIKEQFFYDK